MSWVASLWPLLAGNAEPFGWHYSKCLFSSSTGPVHPQELVVKAVAPPHRCQLRAELLKGKEHRGPGGTAPH